MQITEYKNPFDAITDFEKALAEFTDAPYVVVTDSCTHAIELCLRYIRDDIQSIVLPAKTYLSVPMTVNLLGIPYSYREYRWDGEYNLEGTNVWDSARKLEEYMYRPGEIQCLSFGRTKPLEIGRGGAILLDNERMYKWLKRAVYDGRDLSISPWQDQQHFSQGFHYMMRPEEAVIGMELLKGKLQDNPYSYPDLQNITIS